MYSSSPTARHAKFITSEIVYHYYNTLQYTNVLMACQQLVLAARKKPLLVIYKN